MTKPSEHATDFSILAFAQSDFNFRTTFSDLANLGSIDSCETFGKINPALQSPHCVRFHLASHDDKILFGNAMFRVCKTLSKFAVIGQQNQPRAGRIQTPHGK